MRQTIDYTNIIIKIMNKKFIIIIFLLLGTAFVFIKLYNNSSSNKLISICRDVKINPLLDIFMKSEYIFPYQISNSLFPHGINNFNQIYLPGSNGFREFDWCKPAIFKSITSGDTVFFRVYNTSSLASRNNLNFYNLEFGAYSFHDLPAGMVLLWSRHMKMANKHFIFSYKGYLFEIWTDDVWCTLKEDIVLSFAESLLNEIQNILR